jgi:hypothetical protein
MSPTAAVLPYLVYALTLYLFPFVMLLSILNGLVYPNLRGLTMAAFLGGVACGIMGAAIGSSLEEAKTLDWGSMSELVCALSFAESGYFLIFSGGLFTKSMIGDSLGCFVTSLIMPFLYFLIWVTS